MLSTQDSSIAKGHNVMEHAQQMIAQLVQIEGVGDNDLVAIHIEVEKVEGSPTSWLMKKRGIPEPEFPDASHD